MDITKYFWEMNDKALKDVKRIIKDPNHPKFAMKMTAILSRCSKPKEVFSVVSKKDFMQAWPKIKAYWLKLGGGSDFKDWWETVYEELLEEYKASYNKPKGNPSAVFFNIGRKIRQARIQSGLSQKELAFSVGMKQPDISMIEEGKKNLTLDTLTRLCKILKIRKIDIGV